MTDLVLMVGLACAVLFGVWIMGRLDRFFSSGGILPLWDAEEEQL